MSIALSTIDVSTLSVGQSTTLTGIPPASAELVKTVGNPHLSYYNDSGQGIIATIQTSNHSFSMPAGSWGSCELEPADTQVSLNVVYVIPNAPVSKILATYFYPGEPVSSSSKLGNSPIGISGSVAVSSVSTLSNEGNPANTLVVDIGPSGLSAIVSIYNDHFVWSVDQSGTAHQVLKGNASGTPLQIGQAGDISEVLGVLQVDQTSTFTGETTHSAGLATNTIYALGTTNIGADLSAGTGLVKLPNSAQLANGQSIQALDHTGTSHNILQTDSSDFVTLQGLASEIKINPPTGHATWFMVQGTLYCLADTRGFVAASGASQSYTFENGNFLPDISFFTGTGSGTYNHGYGSAPFFVIPIVNSLGGSATQGYNNVTTTQVTITLGASLSFKAFCV